MEFIIIEDEIYFIEEFTAFFSKEASNHTLTVVHSDQINLINKSVDVVFMDIDLGAFNGIVLAKQIKAKFPNIMIVFLSNREELVYESFDAQPVFFLRKSKYQMDFQKVLNLIDEKKKKKCIIENDEYHLDEILYLEYTNRITTVVCKDGEFSYKRSLQTIMEQLNHECFTYIQRSIVVNLNNIKTIRQDEIELVDCSVFTVSRKYKSELRKNYKRYLLC